MPSSLLNLQQLRQALADPEYITANSFEVARSLSAFYGNGIGEYEFQDLLLRALEYRENFGPLQEVIDGLVREVGLFPYLNPDNLGFADRIAYEFHKPVSTEQAQMVFHRPQSYVYRQLMSGSNVILSAPTSFGKSLIIDALIGSGKFRNILIVVPTIALIDETRRRLSTTAQNYKVITHIFQIPAEKNIYVLTQERAVDHPALESIDFFVIDEFYKLDPERESGGGERSALLNQVFYKLAKRRKQFYLLGPSVIGVSEDLQERLEYTFIHEPYSTVISEIHRVVRKGTELETLVDLCKNIEGQTMIFCQSPNRAATVAKLLIENRVGQAREQLRDAVRWIGQEYHPNWHFTRALENGIGVHHGRIPRAISQYIVRAFNAGDIQFLICTSTLIEGVNTKARNIIIFDNKINKKKYDYFTFNNIRGRSGRMFQHFIGHVYLFHDPPAEEWPLVDVPAFTQSKSASDSLLIQLDEEDLLSTSREKLKEFHEQGLISYETLRANNGISPQAQLEVAKTILASLSQYNSLLRWTTTPTHQQLLAVCQLMWNNFGGANLGSRSVLTVNELASRISQLQKRPTIAELIRAQLRKSSDSDIAVPNVLDFLKLWAGYQFPRLLRAIDRIQRDVFSRHGLQAGNYEAYALYVENMFLDPALVALDEYGIPIQLARKLESLLQPQGDLDGVLRRIKNLNLSALVLTPFERDILEDAQRFIG